MKEMFLEQGAGNGPADREADETTVVDHTLETVHAIQCHNEVPVMSGMFYKMFYCVCVVSIWEIYHMFLERDNDFTV